LLQPKSIIEQLKQCGITHVVWLPDSESKFMYDALQAERDLGFVPVCREGEAFAVAAGLWIGGKNPVDTAAVYTEPLLNAWGIPFYHIETDGDTPKIAEAYTQAQEISRPVAALICVEYSE
jgi:sulfopyruvate decarboxylase subunit alpha